MRIRQDSPVVWLLVIFLAGAVISVVPEKFLMLAMLVGIVAIVIAAGPLLVWLIVRRLNRRDDPRHKKRPPQGPDAAG